MGTEDSTQRAEPTPRRIDWAAILAAHGRWLRTVVLARVGEPSAADDVLQEVQLAAIANGERLRNPDKVAPWLYRIAVAKALEHRRRCGRRKRLMQRYAEHAAPAVNSVERNSLDWLLAEEKQSLVRRAIGCLPGREREILMLKYTEDWSYRQIADHLGVTPSAVESRLHRARERLRKQLAALAPSGEIASAC